MASSRFTHAITEGTSDERPPFPAPNFYLGDEWFETDTGNSYVASLSNPPFPPSGQMLVWKPFDAPSSDFIRYLAPVSGSDSNNGTTPAKAWKTLEKVKENIPPTISGKCRVFVIEPGVSIMPTGKFHLPLIVNPNNTTEPESLVIDARQAFQVTRTASITVADPFGQRITYGGAPLPRGTLIRMTSGALTGFYGSIRDTKVIVPNVQNESTMFMSSVLVTGQGTSVGDTFNVLNQGWTLDMTNGGFFSGVAGISNSRFSLCAAKILGGYGAGVQTAMWGSPLCVFNTGGGGFTVADRGGQWQSNLLPDDLNDPGIQLAAIVALGRDGGGNGGSLNANFDSEISNIPLLATDTALFCEQGCSVLLSPFSLQNSPVIIEQPTWINMSGFAPFAGFDSEAIGMIAGFAWNLDSIGNTNPPSAAIRIAGAGGVAADPESGTWTLNTVRVENNASDGVQLDHGARATMFSVTTDPTLPNTGIGLAVSLGGSASYDLGTATGPNPLTGSLAQTTLDKDAYFLATIKAAVGPAVGFDPNGNVLSKTAVLDSRGSVISVD